MVSIIIPVKKINDYIRESVPKILELDYSDLEILIFPDKKTSLDLSSRAKPQRGEVGMTDKRIRIIPSGKVGPAEKRDLAIKHAKGEILAFLDDDAYPTRGWLKHALKHFRTSNVAAVGGPAITPPHDTLGQKISGAVFESYLGGGTVRHRYLSIGKTRQVDDWPTVNLLIRKDVFRKLGGFDSTYWPGEDTKLCLDIIKAGYKIIYEPKAIVYHHRRSGFLRHLKQIGNYALHRGYFAKRHPETSLKPAYFVPTLFVLYLAFLILIFIGNWKLEIGNFILLPLAIYLALLVLDSTLIAARWRNPLVGLGAAPLIFATHICYGVRFAWGILAPSLDR